jgi:hypothetical protein
MIGQNTAISYGNLEQMILLGKIILILETKDICCISADRTAIGQVFFLLW